MKGQFEENPVLAQERLLTLNEARNHFPVRLSLSAIWRKIRKGSRGVKLETIYLGRRYTSVEAIARYTVNDFADEHRNRRCRFDAVDVSPPKRQRTFCPEIQSGCRNIVPNIADRFGRFEKVK